METPSSKKESTEPNSSTSSSLVTISTQSQTSLIRIQPNNVAQESKASPKPLVQNETDECEYLTSFFSKEMYNSCSCTEELIQKIENSQDGYLARQALALYQDRYARLDKPWNHVTFMYGLGLLYMHFNAYKWAIRAFRETIYIQPNFLRARDIHTRLGLIFKSSGRHKLSEKHFKLAIRDTRPSSGSCSNFELQFHLAHLLELQGKLKEAEEKYEKLLGEKNLPHQLSANIQRQLGCMYCIDCLNPPTKSNNNRHQKDLLDHSHQKMNAALNYLSTSNKALSDPKTSYYLGRCLTNIGKYQDAFASYRSVIDKEESTADTWCSIGVLYHRQNQLTDAQQAYIRAVQFEKNHEAAWLNLASLYENHRQYQDAIKCYQHALRSNGRNYDNWISDRISLIQDQISEVESSLNQQNSKAPPDKLIRLEDLWNFESKKSLERNSSTRVDQALNDHESTSMLKISNDDTKFKTFNGNHNSLKIDQSVVPSHHHSNHLPAKEVIETCNTIPVDTRIDINLLSDELQPPKYFPKTPPYPPLLDSKLYPSTPSVFLETKKDIVSQKLQEYCQSSPISILRNLATVLKLDLGLFSTKTLLESNPEQEISVTSHPYHKQNDDERSSTGSNNSWSCCAAQFKYSIGRYASYQISSFRESLKEEAESKQGTSKTQNSMIKQDHNNEFESTEFSTQLAKRLNSNNNNFNFNMNNHNINNISSNSIQSSNTPCINSPNNSSNPINNINHNTSSDHKVSPSSNGSPAKKVKRECTPINSKHVISAENIDISDEKSWRPQLNELNKLPSFIKCVSASNILTHVGSAIPGLNTATMSMHVRGSRVLKHVRPNNFCSVNINVGPGDYEWCGVPVEYSSIIAKLCNKNGFELEDENWWPSIIDLQKHNIPIFRFSQRPGDLVWINSGTITWVQSTGWCNNISWNVGPLCEMQYRQAAERFELNKLIFCRSAVPMMQLTWNIIMNINIIFDDKLHDHIVGVLRRSLQYCARVKASIGHDNTNYANGRTNGGQMNNEMPKKLLNTNKDTDKNAPINHDDIDNEETHTDDEYANNGETVRPCPKVGKLCSLCECEVFNIHLINTEDKLVYCFECARRIEPNMIENKFTIMEEYELKYLMKLYDDFIETRKRFDSQRNQKKKQQTVAPTTISSTTSTSTSTSTMTTSTTVDS